MDSPALLCRFCQTVRVDDGSISRFRTQKFNFSHEPVDGVSVWLAAMLHCRNGHLIDIDGQTRQLLYLPQSSVSECPESFLDLYTEGFLPSRDFFMYDFFWDICRKPAPFSCYTAKTLWTQPHLSQQMLHYHLDQDTDLASRRIEKIDQVVKWIDSHVHLQGKRVCDLGCGPGLYTQRFRLLGAEVTGVDFSQRAIHYAKANSDRAIRYLHADYLVDDLPSGFDVITLIYTDFCVLSPEQRSQLLSRVQRMLAPNGQLILDVGGMGLLDTRQESIIIENQLMDGFWSATDYVGIMSTAIYANLSLALDRYVIIEPEHSWQVYNWFQHYTPESIESELQKHGFTVGQLTGDLTGKPLTHRSELIGVVATQK